jgi:hypothetical protein
MPSGRPLCGLGASENFQNISKKGAEPEALLQNKTRLRENKKRAGRKPCSENCVDPISPKIGFDLD